MRKLQSLNANFTLENRKQKEKSVFYVRLKSTVIIFIHLPQHSP